MPAAIYDDEALLSSDAEAPAGDAVFASSRLPARRRRTAAAALSVLSAAAALVVLAGLGPRFGPSAPTRVEGTAADAQGAAEQAPCRHAVGDKAGDNPCAPLSKEDEHELENTLTAADTSACSAVGENCTASRCCKGAGLQCYAKDNAYAECRANCTPGPDPTFTDGWPWSCEELGKRSPGEPPVCAKAGEDCSRSQCCAATGMQCYEKAPGWAACKAECIPGVDVTDVDDKPWSCKALGRRTPGPADWLPKVCAASGASCLDKSCCSTPGEQCFEKNPYWGVCAKECQGGWTCGTRGSRTPLPAAPAGQGQAPVAKWVADKCSKTGADCSDTKCCVAEGNQCFRKNASHAVCRGACTPGVDLYDADGPQEWECKPLGPLTPGLPLEPYREGKEVAEWVGDRCAASGSENCLKSRCCKDAGKQCYEKDSGWGACMQGCVPGPMEGDKSGGNWTCRALGPRTRAAWKSPTLYCFSVIQPFGYERGLMLAQQSTGAGIWACEEYTVFSTEKVSLGFGPNGPVETVTFVPAPVVRSKDYTAGNAELFMHVWDALSALGIWRTTDWTVKVDPDAVLLPPRLKQHLKPHNGEKVYVVNCAKPFMPEGPMMFGALEAISASAISAYFAGAGDCAGGLPWHEWGEDLFMGKCLEKLGVKRLNDFTIYSDGVCNGVDCTDPDAAAFHPKKDVASWMACLKETEHPVERSPTDAPQWFKDYMASYAGR